MIVELPQSLTKNLADAEAEVVSWSAHTQELVLQIRKEIGPELGHLRFSGVSRVDLPPRLTLAGIGAGSSSPSGIVPESDETVFHFHGAWGETYFVVAESLT
jgi:hypothetical protein